MKQAGLDVINHKHRGKTHVYTDGSKDPERYKAGASFVIPDHDHYVPIRTDPNLSVFTTELIAIEYAIVWLMKNKSPQATIFTDSLSSVQALQSGYSNTRPDKINIILSLLDKAKSKGQHIDIEWIPSHVGIPGNEAADATAKLGMLVGLPDKTLPSKAEIYPIINKIIMKEWQHQWDSSLKGISHKCLQPTVRKTTTMFSPNRKHDRIYTRLRLSHNGLLAENRFEKADFSCRKCSDPSAETIEHVFFECETNTTPRKELEATLFNLGYRTISLRELLSPPPPETYRSHR